MVKALEAQHIAAQEQLESMYAAKLQMENDRYSIFYPKNFHEKCQLAHICAHRRGGMAMVVGIDKFLHLLGQRARRFFNVLLCSGSRLSCSLPHLDQADV